MKAPKPKPTHPAEDAPHDPISGLLHATRTAALEVSEAVNIARYLAERADKACRTEVGNIAAMLESVQRRMGEINQRVLAVKQGAFAKGGEE